MVKLLLFIICIQLITAEYATYALKNMYVMRFQRGYGKPGTNKIGIDKMRNIKVERSGQADYPLTIQGDIFWYSEGETVTPRDTVSLNIKLNFRMEYTSCKTFAVKLKESGDLNISNYSTALKDIETAYGIHIDFSSSNFVSALWQAFRSHCPDIRTSILFDKIKEYDMLNYEYEGPIAELPKKTGKVYGLVTGGRSEHNYTIDPAQDNKGNIELTYVGKMAYTDEQDVLQDVNIFCDIKFSMVFHESDNDFTMKATIIQAPCHVFKGISLSGDFLVDKEALAHSIEKYFFTTKQKMYRPFV